MVIIKDNCLSNIRKPDENFADDPMQNLKTHFPDCVPVKELEA